MNWFSQDERIQHLIEQIDMLTINARALKKAVKLPHSATRGVHMNHLISSSRLMISACDELMSAMEYLENKTMGKSEV